MNQNNKSKAEELNHRVQWVIPVLEEECEKEGISIIIREAYRSYGDQVKAWERFKRGEIAAAARPGTSLHGIGFAIDITVIGGTIQRVVEIAKKYGVTQPLPKNDPYHLELVNVGSMPVPQTSEMAHKGLLRRLLARGSSISTSIAKRILKRKSLL